MHFTMSSIWAYFAVLVFCALTGYAVSYPEGTDGRQSLIATPSKEAFLAACPHTIRRLATQQEIVGTWYGLELLHNNTLKKRADGCLQYNITILGDQLAITLNAIKNGTVNISQSFTFSKITDDIWKNDDEINDRSAIGISLDENLMVFCQTKTGDLNSSMMSMLMGRRPETTEQQVQSTHRPSAATSKKMYYNLQDCTEPR